MALAPKQEREIEKYNMDYTTNTTDDKLPPRVVFRDKYLTIEAPWGGNSLFTIEPTSGSWFGIE